MKHYLGIDLGTSSLKVVVVNQSGEILNSATKSYGVHTPQDGWIEQNTTQWLTALSEALAEVEKLNSQILKEIRAISVTGQMHGIVPVDNNGNALHHAIIWSDRRNEEELAAFHSEFTNEEWVAVTGNRPNISFTLGKIMWFKKHYPDLYEKTNKFLLPKDFLRRKLTDTFETDYSDASATLLMDLHTLQWSKKIIKTFQIDETKLPEIKSSTALTGSITRKAARAFGLNEGTAVICGCGDAQAQAIGNGIINSKDWLCTIGTSGQLFVSTDEPAIVKNGTLHSFAHAASGKWVLMGATLSAGMSFKWLTESIFSNDIEIKDLLDLASTASPGAKKLLFLPYLFGERSPYMDEKAKGTFIGFTNEHTKAEMARAVVEGVLFSLYQSFKIVEETVGHKCEHILLTGGAAQHDLWVTAAANIFNVPVVRNRNRGGGAYGAAMLAAVGNGDFNNLLEVSDCWGLHQYEKVYHPNQTLHEDYEKLFLVFAKAYDALKEVFHRLHDCEVSGNKTKIFEKNIM
ncbi:xylulokinase [Bacillus sp. AFS031507]|uniref:xylulokinase n=1 Tax=Bacillus sp. AFS031507 TaxID=2033496 RepID=UPI000BFEA2B8|nr:xylulokinase [Bacillus sp. AFS031507]PGY15129.1 xylulokinase [Bacillus sp. AFS031507]